MPVPVWGWADPGEKVEVSVAGQSKTATADASGKWSLKLDALKTGGPHVFRVKAKNSLELADVVVGETWLCSGQSNMGMTVNRVANAEAEMAAAKFPQIRMLQVDHVTAEEPKDDVKATWVVCTPQTVGAYSATAYFFGRELHQQLKRPVGLINSSWGGTPIQAWTSIKAHEAVPQMKPIVENLKRAIETYDPEIAKKQYQQMLDRYEKAAAKAKAEGKAFKTRRPSPMAAPRLSPSSAGRLYNAMIAPLVPYAIRGAIWYQGEANAGGAALYGIQLRAMISSWRADWQQGDFPFLFVQLPNFMALQQQPSETSGWPLIREQFLKALSVPNTGMAVTIDIGEADDIHPRNKQDVGRRLAWWTLAKTYRMGLPRFRTALTVRPRSWAKACCSTSIARAAAWNRETAVRSKVSPLRAKTTSSSGPRRRSRARSCSCSTRPCPPPEAVRYLWANNPNPQGNLVNQAGLPASPFRTDDWKD